MLTIAAISLVDTVVAFTDVVVALIDATADFNIESIVRLLYGRRRAVIVDASRFGTAALAEYDDDDDNDDGNVLAMVAVLAVVVTIAALISAVTEATTEAAEATVDLLFSAARSRLKRNANSRSALLFSTFLRCTRPVAGTTIDVGVARCKTSSVRFRLRPLYANLTEFTVSSSDDDDDGQFLRAFAAIVDEGSLDFRLRCLCFCVCFTAPPNLSTVVILLLCQKINVTKQFTALSFVLFPQRSMQNLFTDHSSSSSSTPLSASYRAIV